MTTYKTDTLHTSRLTLVPLSLDDVPALFILVQNPATIEDFQYVAQKPEDVEAWVRSSVDDGTPSWTIRLAEQVIGMIEADIRRDAIARLGYFMAEEQQGKGYTTEALRAVLEWLFMQTLVHRAEADITPGNIASCRVVEKLGFRFEGTLRKNWFYKGQWHDSLEYSLMRDEWERLQSPAPLPALHGLKPHTHAERAAIIEQLVPLWQKKFGDNLIAIGASASYARSQDIAYSDLELDLFVKEKPVGEDTYLQRVVDGMLIEVIYHTPEGFFHDRTGLPPHWHISASDRLLPVYNAPALKKIVQQVQASRPAEAEFWRAAAGERYKLQENFGKVLNAVEQNNVEGVSLLVMDAALILLQILALINQQPFVTFARYIEQARQFPIKPERFDDLLDILVQGTYRDLPHLREVVLAVFAGMEQLFEQRGMHLYDDPLDPNLPNPSLSHPPIFAPSSMDHCDTLPGANEGTEGGVRLVPVDRSNWRQCIKLPTGPDHKHVASNAVSIAEAQFWAGSKSCCIYHDDEMVGYALYNLDFDDDLRLLLWVGRLMIAEPQRGKGYGRAALQQIIAEARQQGCVEVALSTHPDNVKAIGLYESMGFHATEIEDGEMVYVCPLS